MGRILDINLLIRHLGLAKRATEAHKDYKARAKKSDKPNIWQSLSDDFLKKAEQQILMAELYII